MSMNLESIKNALGRFECSFEGDYPQLAEMRSIETRVDGKEAKEEDEGLELSFFGEQINAWLARAGKATHPITRTELEGNLVVKPASELFALTLAIAVAEGHFEALKKDGQNFNLQSFLESKDYQEALALGNSVLANLKAAPGDTLKTKIKAANLTQIKGTVGELHFLTKVLRLNVNNLNPGSQQIDIAVADLFKINIPVSRPALEMQRDSKDRALAEVRSSEYVGLGYPLERNVKGQPSSPNERRAMRFMQNIYDSNIALELLEGLLSMAAVDKNVSCLTVELVSKLVCSFYEGECNIDIIYRAMNLLRANLKKVPAWSGIKQDSLRPYLQVMEQLCSCFNPEIAIMEQMDARREGNTQKLQAATQKEIEYRIKYAEFFLSLHEFKTEMLNLHPVFPDANPKKQMLPEKAKPVEVVIKDGQVVEKSKMQGFIEFANTIQQTIFPLIRKAEPIAKIGDALKTMPVHANDIGRSRVEGIVSEYEQSLKSVIDASVRPAAPVVFHMPQVAAPKPVVAPDPISIMPQLQEVIEEQKAYGEAQANGVSQKNMTAQDALNGMARLQCPLLGGDYPTLENMCLIEVKENAELFFFSRVDIMNWINTKADLNTWISYRGIEIRNPATNLAFAGATEADFNAGGKTQATMNSMAAKVKASIRSARQLFALSLAAVAATGQTDKVKAADDSFDSFTGTEDYKTLLEEGNQILAKLKVAPGTNLKEKLVALNLDQIKGTAGELKFLEGLLHLNLAQLDSEQKSDADVVIDIAALKSIWDTTIPSVLPSIEDQRQWADRVIAEIAAPQYKGRGYPLGRSENNNRHEQKAMRFVKNVYAPEVALELLQKVLKIATVDRNVACLSVEIVAKLADGYRKQFFANAPEAELKKYREEILHPAIDASMAVLKKIPAWSLIKEDSLRPYLQNMETLFEPIQDTKKWSELFVALHELKTDMLKRHPVFPSAKPSKQILPGKKKEEEVVIKDGLVVAKPKMQGFLEFAGLRRNFVYREKIKDLAPAELQEISKQLKDIGCHANDETAGPINTLIETYGASVGQVQNEALKEILSCMTRIRNGLKSGDKAAMEQFDTIDLYASVGQFSETEALTVSSQFDALRQDCKSENMQLSRTEVERFINQSEKPFRVKAKLNANS